MIAPPRGRRAPGRPSLTATAEPILSGLASQGDADLDQEVGRGGLGQRDTRARGFPTLSPLGDGSIETREIGNAHEAARTVWPASW